MSRVTVNEKVLHWAVKRSGLTLNSLERKFPKIRQWVTDKSQPTLRQLESLAKATRTPLGFFFLTVPPDDHLPITNFRTLGDETLPKSSPDLLETIQSMQQRQYWMREFLIDQGQKPLPFVQSVQVDESPISVANRIRHALNFDKGWASLEANWTDALGILRRAIESAGIIVVVNGIVGNNTHRKLDPKEFRGFVLVDEYAPFIFVNGADGKAAQMFTLAHELAHVFMGSSAAFDLRELRAADDPTEQMCDQVAAEFLIPEGEMSQFWPSIKKGQEPFQTVARQFKVSALVAARRALDLALITKEAFLKFYKDYQRNEHRLAARQSKGGNFYLNQNLRISQRFASAVVQATKEGKLLYSEAYQLTGLYGKTFNRYVSSLEIGGT